MAATNMLPLVPGLQEQIDNISSSTTEVKPLGRVVKIDFENNKFAVQDGETIELTTDEEKIKQWIRLILITGKDKYGIYKNTDFYCNMENLIGKKLVGYNAFYQSEIQREVREALLKNRYIASVDNFSFSKVDKRTWNVQYVVTLVTGQVVSSKEEVQ